MCVWVWAGEGGGCEDGVCRSGCQERKRGVGGCVCVCVCVCVCDSDPSIWNESKQKSQWAWQGVAEGRRGGVSEERLKERRNR